MTVTSQNIVPLLSVFILTCTQVLAELCQDGETKCRLPRKCCESGCCYDDNYHDEDRYAYGYRLSVWNMWYFWFVVLFVLMSCFGGCGYYKQRQRIIRTQQGVGGGTSFLSAFQMPSRRARGRGAGTVTLEPAFGIPFAYSGPGADVHVGPGVTLTPPPYSEVVSNPDQFPASKSTLPGHQGHPVVTPATGDRPEYANQATTEAMPQPPSYSEVVGMTTSQNTPLASPVCQNTPSPVAATNQIQASRDTSVSQHEAAS